MSQLTKDTPGAASEGKPINKSLRQNLTKEMLTEVEAVFLTVADPHTKSMTYAKLPLALKALGMSLNEVDDPGNLQYQVIDFEKFIEQVVACMRHPNWAANEMNETFGLYDKDSNGLIDPAELRRVFVKIGENVLESELADQLREFDIDGDFQVSFNTLISSLFVTIILTS
jgi:Ca2+-binding EF-hand superfamily protein